MARRTLGLRRNLKEEQRRAAITAAAVKVFSTRGFDRTTMDDIVAEAGCSKSLIYWYWKNKADLFAWLIDLCMTRYEELLARTLKSEAPFPEKLDVFLGEFTRLFRESEDLNKVVHFGSLHAARNPGEDFRERVNAHYRKVQRGIEEIFRQGVEAGLVRRNVDIAALALSLLMSVEGYIYMSILEDRMPLERALIRSVRRYVLSNILETEPAGKIEATRTTRLPGRKP